MAKEWMKGLLVVALVVLASSSSKGSHDATGAIAATTTTTTAHPHACASCQARDSFIFCDPTRPKDVRVADLIASLTLQEKVRRLACLSNAHDRLMWKQMMMMMMMTLPLRSW